MKDKFPLMLGVIAVAVVVGLFIFNYQSHVEMKVYPAYCEYGDVDGDGVIGNGDLAFFLIPSENWTWDMKERGDVNNDGVIDNSDYNLIFTAVAWGQQLFPVLNTSSSNYQIDEPPQVRIAEINTTAYVGEPFTVKIFVNDSNGEILTTHVRVTKDGVPGEAYPINEKDVSPGSTVAFTWIPDEAGEEHVQGEVTYRYRTYQWIRTEEVVINVLPSSVIANFTYSIDGRTVYFLDNSMSYEGSIISWHWDFGDGQTSTLANPVHLYDRGGTYNVTLTVSNGIRNATVVKQVVIKGWFLSENVIYIAYATLVMIGIAGVWWVRKK